VSYGAAVAVGRGADAASDTTGAAVGLSAASPDAAAPDDRDVTTVPKPVAFGSDVP